MPPAAAAMSPLKFCAQITASAVISKNNFKFKSLSNWAYNIAQGCVHGCSFCYVPMTSLIKSEKRLEKTAKFPATWKAARAANNEHWGDIHWGEYCFLRTWDEAEFLKSLKKAERQKKLAPDGHRAVMFCSTTDPYQTLYVRGDDKQTVFLNEQRKLLVRNALELILNESTLNVRILTRSHLAKKDFDLFKKFGNRLTFGMSLPTLNKELSKIYEPHAPGPTVKLNTLKAAVDAGLHVFVALAPTLPDEEEDELRATMTEIVKLKPITIFHEAINRRAENTLRIEKQAKSMKVTVKSAVLQTDERWMEYAYARYALIDKIAKDLKIPHGVLHQWPDEVLADKKHYLQMKQMQSERDFGRVCLSPEQEKQCEEEWNDELKPWLDYWHNPSARISSWPGKSLPNW